MDDGAAKFDDAVDNFVDGFADEQFFAIDEGDDGVGRLLNQLDEIGIHRHAASVQSGQLNHGNGRVKPGEMHKMGADTVPWVRHRRKRRQAGASELQGRLRRFGE